MATKLNVGKETRKKYKQAKEKYKEAVVATNVSDGSIAIYFEDKMEEAKEIIAEAKGTTINMLSMLEKDSDKRKDYKEIVEELKNMQENIKKLK